MTVKGTMGTLFTSFRNIKNLPDLVPTKDPSLAPFLPPCVGVDQEALTGIGRGDPVPIVQPFKKTRRDGFAGFDFHRYQTVPEIEEAVDFRPGLVPPKKTVGFQAAVAPEFDQFGQIVNQMPLRPAEFRQPPGALFGYQGLQSKFHQHCFFLNAGQFGCPFKLYSKLYLHSPAEKPPEYRGGPLGEDRAFLAENESVGGDCFAWLAMTGFYFLRTPRIIVNVLNKFT
jgi:hypothetical protein